MNTLNKEHIDYLYNTRRLTLREIGRKYGVSYEWIRLLMKGWGISRRDEWRRLDYSSVKDYINSGGNGSFDVHKILMPTSCSRCGSDRNLHIHHKKYPAETEADFEVLCASCHIKLHNRGKYFGLEYSKRLRIYEAYNEGITAKALALEYNISRSYIYRIIGQIRNGWRTTRG